MCSQVIVLERKVNFRYVFKLECFKSNLNTADTAVSVTQSVVSKSSRFWE